MTRIYCPRCDWRWETTVYATEDELVVEGVTVTVRQEHARCPNCADEIATEAMCKRNYDAALAARSEKTSPTI